MATIDLNNWDKDINNFDSNKHQLYYEIEEALRKSPKNVEYLWRRSWAAVILANSIRKYKNSVHFKNLMFEAMKYAEIAIEQNSDCFEAYLSYCTGIGELAQFVSIRKRIDLSRKWKEHLDIAKSMNPGHYRLNHLFGCYYYSPVPRYTWFEKRFARILFGPIPVPSYEESLSALFTAHRLKPKWIRNYLWISKVLIALNRQSEAFIWMDRALQLGFRTEEDVNSRREIIKLRYKYSK